MSSELYDRQFNTSDNNELYFGKYYGKTYDFVYKNDKEYCKWIIKASKKGTGIGQLYCFAYYIGDREKIEKIIEVLTNIIPNGFDELSKDIISYGKDMFSGYWV